MTRDERRKKAQEKQKKRFENRGKKSSNGKYSFNFPDNTEYYKIGDKNVLRILSWIVGTKNYPLINGEREYEKGDEVYNLEFWEHSFIGALKLSFLCLEKNFGELCPICEENKRLYNEGKIDGEGGARSIAAKHRVAYWVEDLLDEGKKKVFTTSYKMFEEDGVLEKKAELEDDDEAYTPFDPIEGSIIKFSGKDKTANGFKFKEPKSFRFLPFDDRISNFKNGKLDEDAVLKAIDNEVCLDSCMVIKEYEEMRNCLFGDDFADDDDDDENDEDDEKEDLKKIEKANRSRRKIENKKECPEGDRFGVDYDKELCESDGCDLRSECRSLSDEKEK